MYAIRLELKTNWRFIFNNKCFFVLFERTDKFYNGNNCFSNTYLYFKSYYTESYPVLHIKKITNLQPDQHSL